MSEMTTQPAGSRPTTWWRPILAGVGVIAIVAGGAYVVDRSRDDLPTAPAAGAGPLEGLVVHDGDAVSASGVIVEEPGQDRLVCTPEESDDMMYPPGEEPPYVCSPLAVPLTGGDDIELPSWIERDGVWFTEAAVTVQGLWRDGTIEVGSVTPTPDGAGQGPTDDGAWRVPCEPPAGGWADFDGIQYEDMDPAEYERAGVALHEELAAHPETYHANWVAYPDGDPMAPGAPANDMGEPLIEHLVMMVSTVDDPVATQARLAAVYPGNLCVLQVEHSGAELEAVAQRISTADGSWRADAANLSSSVTNKITVDLPVVDEAAVARIGADAALLQLSPLVRPS